MGKLLRLQLRNLFHGATFYVCLILTLLMSQLFTIISLFTHSAVVGPIFEKAVDFLSGEVGIIGMLFVTLFCTFDFMEGTTKNIVARGYSKVKLLFSKYLASLIGLLVMYLIVILIIVGVNFSAGLGFNESGLLMLIVLLIKIVAYTVLYATIAFVLEKNSSAIIVNLFLPNLMTLLLSIADSNLKIEMSKYWIGNVDTEFMANPSVNNIAFPIIMYAVYIAFILFVGIRISKKKEIK